MFYFHKVAYVHYLGEVNIFHTYMSKKISSSLQQCKNYKNRSRFPKVMITSVLPPFYGSQCTSSKGSHEPDNSPLEKYSKVMHNNMSWNKCGKTLLNYNEHL